MRWFCVLVVCEFPSLDVEEKFFISCASWWRGLERGGGGDGVGVIGLLISSLLWNQIWSQITAAKSKNFGASSKEREEGTWI